MRDGTATRERIEQVAMRLFVTQGVAETTIRHIAQGAGVAEGALYRHYRGKDELILDLFRRHYAAFARRLDALQARSPDSRDKLQAMVEECCRVFDQDPVLFRFLLLVQHHSLHRIEGPETPVEVVRAAVAHGMAAGEILTGDPDLATALVMGIIIQPATFKTYGRLPGPMLPLAGRLAAACWNVLQA
ncbi:MAG TPA: TetR/AcrR family transcriptional regulator [Stellaceae bacterium]|nr:TetR/AcrR family transcriptional regulator [Stellaceae bacterium]